MAILAFPQSGAYARVGAEIEDWTHGGSRESVQGEAAICWASGFGRMGLRLDHLVGAVRNLGKSQASKQERKLEYGSSCTQTPIVILYVYGRHQSVAFGCNSMTQNPEGFKCIAEARL